MEELARVGLPHNTAWQRAAVAAVRFKQYRALDRPVSDAGSCVGASARVLGGGKKRDERIFEMEV